jgi:hypothetical protein
MSDATECPPNWHEYRPPRSPPRPGTNPRYDELEDWRRRYERYEKEAETSLKNHDAKREGLVANRDYYQQAKERIAQKLLELLTSL